MLRRANVALRASFDLRCCRTRPPKCRTQHGFAVAWERGGHKLVSPSARTIATFSMRHVTYLQQLLAPRWPLALLALLD
jgi:hypothetical protein